MKRGNEGFFLGAFTVLLGLGTLFAEIVYLFAKYDTANAAPPPLWQGFIWIVAIYLALTALGALFFGSAWPGKPSHLAWIAAASHLPAACLILPVGPLFPIIAFALYYKSARRFGTHEPEPAAPGVVLLRPALRRKIPETGD